MLWRTQPQGTVTLSLPSSAADKSEKDQSTGQKDQQGKEQGVPRGYLFHVASLITIDPGEEILFSLPVNHLNRNWHIEIPFNFELPQGKGPRDPLNGGEPLMAVIIHSGIYLQKHKQTLREVVILSRISGSA